jgi:hypothetical protein
MKQLMKSKKCNKMKDFLRINKKEWMIKAKEQIKN